MKHLIAVTLLAPVVAHAASWHYETAANKLTDKSYVVASSRSDNTFSFSFPYKGNTKAALAIRNERDYPEVMFAIERGQLVCSSCALVVRFDDEDPIDFGATRSNDGRTNLVFIDDGVQFALKALTAKRIRVEFVAFKEGVHVADFRFSSPYEWKGRKSGDDIVQQAIADAKRFRKHGVTAKNLEERCRTDKEELVECLTRVRACLDSDAPTRDCVQIVDIFPSRGMPASK